MFGSIQQITNNFFPQTGKNYGYFPNLLPLSSIVSIEIISGTIPNYLRFAPVNFAEPYFDLIVAEVPGDTFTCSNIVGNDVFGTIYVDYSANANQPFLNVLPSGCIKDFWRNNKVPLSKLGSLTISIVKDSGTLMDFGGPDLIINGITIVGSNIQVSTTTDHNMITGDLAYIQGVQSIIQTLTIDILPTAGAGTVSFTNASNVTSTSATVPADFATGAALQTFLETLPSVGALNLVVLPTGAPSGPPFVYTIYFTGALANVLQPNFIFTVGTMTPTTSMVDVTGNNMLEQNAINNPDGYLISVVSSTEFEVPVTITIPPVFAPNGRVIVAKRQNNFLFKVRASTGSN